MTGSELPGKGLSPSWQTSSEPDGMATSLDAHPPSETSSMSPEASLLEKAAKFLREDDIREAPVKRKRKFLQSKGLSDEQINTLLAAPIERNSDGAQDTGEKVEREQGDTSKMDVSKSKDQVSQGADNSTATKDPPPIITYPEFLLHSRKPPPLVTAHRLLTTGYVVSGAAAAVYGTSKFLIEPMLGSLSSARRSLFETASTNVNALNEKLGRNVSTIPASLSLNADSRDSEIESIASDPARFFSRTIATQTSPRLSRSSSDSSIHSASPTPNTTQMSQLAGLRDTLEKIKPSDTSDQAIQESVAEVREYLDKLQYSAHPNISKVWKYSSSDDNITKLKADIRSVKGVLLSARNFPSSSGR